MAIALSLQPRRITGKGLAMCGEGVTQFGTWLRRLGDEVGLPESRRADGAKPPDQTGVPLAPQPLDATLLAGWLWGEGHVQPGSVEECLDLLRPFALTETSRLLHLGAGLGTMSLAIAKATGCRIAGFERDPALLATALAQPRSARRVTFQHLQADTLARGGAQWDHGFGRFVLHAEPDRAALLAACRTALRAGGQIALVEYVAPAASPSLQAWQSRQTGQHQAVWPMHIWRRAFADAGFDLRIEEDISARHRAAILAGWHGLLTGRHLLGIAKRQLEPMVAAAERWMSEAMLLQTGALQVRRFHAILPP